MKMKILPLVGRTRISDKNQTEGKTTNRNHDKTNSLTFNPYLESARWKIAATDTAVSVSRFKFVRSE